MRKQNSNYAQIFFGNYVHKKMKLWANYAHLFLQTVPFFFYPTSQEHLTLIIYKLP